jgi:GNAT superfamily N-acetyltransferase
MSRDDLLAYVAEAFTDQKIRDELADPNQVFFLATEEPVGRSIVGFCKVWLGVGHPCVKTERPAKFERSYVTPQFQGQGLGRKFFELRRDLAFRAGCTGAWLSVWDRNTDAIAFHRRMGFVEVGEEPFQVGADLQRDLILFYPAEAKFRKE